MYCLVLPVVRCSYRTFSGVSSTTSASSTTSTTATSTISLSTPPCRSSSTSWDECGPYRPPVCTKSEKQEEMCYVAFMFLNSLHYSFYVLVLTLSMFFQLCIQFWYQNQTCSFSRNKKRVASWRRDAMCLKSSVKVCLAKTYLVPPRALILHPYNVQCTSTLVIPNLPA